MSEVIQRLAVGEHRVVVSRVKSAAELRECIKDGFVIVKFTETRGGTELGIRLDGSKSPTSDADLSASKDSIGLVGVAVLDYNRVEISVQVSLQTLQGTGTLKVLQDERQWRASAETTPHA